MPYKSEAQRRYIWWKYNQDIKHHRKPTINAPEWQAMTGHQRLPMRVRRGVGGGVSPSLVLALARQLLSQLTWIPRAH